MFPLECFTVSECPLLSQLPVSCFPLLCNVLTVSKSLTPKSHGLGLNVFLLFHCLPIISFFYFYIIVINLLITSMFPALHMNTFISSWYHFSVVFGVSAKRHMFLVKMTLLKIKNTPVSFKGEVEFPFLSDS